MKLPALISEKKMPFTAAFKAELMAGEPFYKWNQSGQRDLIPPAPLRSIIAEADKYLEPANKTEILQTAKTLVGSFPQNQIKDPEIFISSLIFVMSDYPVDILRIGILGLIKTKKWIPAAGEVNEEMQKLFLKRSGLKNRAQLQLEEHKRRKNNA